MRPLVEVRDRPRGDAHRLTLIAAAPHSPLVHESHLGAGLHVTLDALAPHRWLRLSVDRFDEVSSPMMAALIGADAVRAVSRDALIAVATDTARATPWMRVATVDTIDRFLQVPLDQALVDAERGVSRFHAAATLAPDGDAHRLVLGEALHLARRASSGLTAHLRRRRHSRLPLPAGLRAGLGQLADGYAGLAAQVAGPDRDLAAVQRAWRALHDRGQPGPRAGSPPRRPAPRAHPRCTDLLGLLDPRQVPARVVAMSADPACGEVCISAAAGNAVRVEVPAFGPVDADVAGRLLVRVVDRRTSDPIGHGLLTMAPKRRSAHRLWFGCTVPLSRYAPPDPDIAELRVDVYDALGDAPAGGGGDDVHNARRAAVFLREWRRLVAVARLTDAAPALGARVADLASRLRADAAPGQPTDADLRDLIGRDDEDTTARIRDRSTAMWSTSAVGRLLVAEVASASDEIFA